MTTMTSDAANDRASSASDRDIRDAVEACRKAMGDLDIDAKEAALEELRAWVELERSTHETQQ